MERLNRFIVHSVPWLTLGMVLVTFVVVILRYLFGRGWVWMQEIALYMHAFTFLLAASYTLSRDEHVRVDILYRPMDVRRKALVNLLGSALLLIPCCAVLFYQSLPSSPTLGPCSKALKTAAAWRRSICSKPPFPCALCCCFCRP